MGMYGYQVTLKRAPNAAGELRGQPDDALTFAAENHDDLFDIVARQRAKALWSEDTAAQLAVGLKLLSEVALQHRKDPLFEPLMLPLREFIGRLKALPANDAAAAE